MIEVVVIGVRESFVQGLENKRAATQVVESIVASAAIPRRADAATAHRVKILPSRR